jgi:hypothetical protein
MLRIEAILRALVVGYDLLTAGRRQADELFRPAPFTP